MNRFVKIALIVLGVLVSLIVAAVIALPFVIDPNDYRDDIAAAVEERTGREFTMSGELELSVFPWLGVTVGESRLSNAQGFGDQPFAEIGSAQVSVRLLPLLSRRIEVGTVSLDGMRLRLARNEDGGTNWDDLVETFAAEEEPAEEEPPPEEENGGFSMPELEVGAIEVSDAAVTYSDAQAGETYELRDLNLSTGRLVLGESFPVNLRFALDAASMGLSSETRLVAEVQPDVENQFYRFSDLSLNVRASGDAVPGGEQQVTVSGNGEADLQSGRLTVADLSLQGAGLNVTGNVDGTSILGDAAFNGRLTVKEFDPRAVMTNLGMEAPETRDENVLGSAGLDTQFEATLTQAKLKRLMITLDDSTLKGDASVENFADPAVVFQLALDQLNVDDYLPPAAEDNEAEESETAEQTPAGGAEISLEPLEALRLDGRLTADSLTVANLKFEDAELAVVARDGVLTVQPLGANLYGGNMRVSSRVSAAGEQPSYAIKGNLNGLKLGPLLKDLVGQEKVSALANLNIDLTTTGRTVEQMKKTLGGSLSFEFRDGLFNGFDLSRILGIASQRLQGNSVESTDADGETKFSRFAAAFSVEDGLMRGGNLDLTTPYAQLGGEGTFDLVSNQLDYTVNANIPEDADSGVFKQLAGYQIPIKLSGNLFSPRYSIDVKSALKSVGQQKLEEEKAELKQKVDEEREKVKQDIDKKVDEKRQELGDKLQEGLGNLFGGGKKKEAEEEAANDEDGGQDDSGESADETESGEQAAGGE